MKKLHNNRGETLIEVLGAIVIASLSVALMFGCIMASTTMNKEAKAVDEQYYSGLTEADARTSAPEPEPTSTPDPTASSTPTPLPTSGTVTIKRVDPEASAAPEESEDPETSESPTPTETPDPSGPTGTSVTITIYGSDGIFSYSQPSDPTGTGGD